MPDLRPEALTWTSLLAKWVEFAQASLALPADAEGRRWRESVASIINLQAVTFALGDLERLAAADRPLARDRAEMLIRESMQALGAIWSGVAMPETILEMASDARAALEMSAFVGAVELVWPGPEPMVMPEVPVPEPRGTLNIMQPGTIVMPGEPVAWWAEHDGVEVPGCVRQPVWPPRQVYRQLDESGRITGDVIAGIDETLPVGMPLLVPLFEDGRPVGSFTMDADTWLARQREAMTGESIPVVEQSS